MKVEIEIRDLHKIDHQIVTLEMIRKIHQLSLRENRIMADTISILKGIKEESGYGK